MSVLPQHLKSRSKESPRGKKRGKNHHLATIVSFGGLSDKAVPPSRGITRSFCSHSMKCGLTDAMGVELKCGALTEVQSAPQDHAQKFAITVLRLRAHDSLPLNLRLDSSRRLFTSPSATSDAAIEDYGRSFQWMYAQIFPDFPFRARF